VSKHEKSSRLCPVPKPAFDIEQMFDVVAL
jgi:hypothetical protein